MFNLYKRCKEAQKLTHEERQAAIESDKARILAASENVSPEFEMIIRDALSAENPHVMHGRLIRSVVWLEFRNFVGFWKVIFRGR